MSRELLEISYDSGLSERFWEPVAEQNQWLAADSLLLGKQGILFARSGNSSVCSGNVQDRLAHGQAALAARVAADPRSTAAESCSRAASPGRKTDSVALIE